MHTANEKSKMFELSKTKSELLKRKKPASKVVPRHCEGGNDRSNLVFRVIIRNDYF